MISIIPQMSFSDEESGKPFGGVSEDLVPNREQKLAGASDIDFDGLLKIPLKVHEDLTKGCGGMLWPAGMVLARYLLRKDKSELMDKSIVELGAGGGLVGLSIALGFPLTKPLHLTDQLPMFSLMERNIALNNLQLTVKPSIYDWGSPASISIPKHPDIILAAECVYFEPAFPLLQQTLKDLIGPETICYFCFKKRRRADMNFIKVAKKMFVVEDVVDDPDKPVWSRENLHMYRITAKPRK